MSENITINFADALKYEPYTGDGAAVLLPFDGMVRTKILKFKTGTSSTGNKTVKLVLAVAEDDVSGTLYADIAVTGARSDGKANVEKFFDLLISAGQNLDQLRQAGQAGKEGTVNEILNGLIKSGTVVICDVKADTYEGRTSSKVNNFVSPQRFSDAQTAGTARRTRSDGGASSITSNGGGGASTSAKSDPLQLLS